MGHKQTHSTVWMWCLTLVCMLSLWLTAVDGGLLEEKAVPAAGVNIVDKKTDKSGFEPLPCIDTDRSGVVPCDNNPKCCHKDSPRIPGTDYCCPPATHQYHFKTQHELVCACTL